MKKNYLMMAVLATLLSAPMHAQTEMTRESVLAMTTEELADLPLEELMKAVEVLGVSSIDELFAIIMNKNVSSASKIEESTFTSPLSSTVITRNEMRTYGITNVEEALRLVPGMIVSEKYNGIYDVQMRGLNNIPDNNLILYTENSNTLLMIDGRIAHNYAMGAPCLENLPISVEDIDRIEVVRGANSALYGPNAVTGVINIITAKPDAVGKGVVSGNASMGNNAWQGDFSLHRAWTEKVATALTFNMQERRRPTDKIYAIPQSNTYYATEADEWPTTGTTLTMQEMGVLMGSGKLRSLEKGGYLSVEEMRGHLTIGGTSTDSDGNTLVTLYPTHSGFANSNIAEPDLSRRNIGVNGYISLSPTKKTRVDITGGYQYSLVGNTPLGSEDFSLRNREYSTAYVNVSAQIGSLRLLGNYNGGDNDYCVGNHSFRMENRLANAQAEYDIQIGGLNIRPGVSWQKVYFGDHEPVMVDYGDGEQEDSGFFGYYSRGDKSCHNEDFSASVRLDYKHGGLRLIGGARFDKTTYPDEWNPTWQFVAAYKFSDTNFVRLTYGRARRSATLCNTSSNYNWHRNGTPEYMQFVGNEDTPLVKTDNIELGYRWKPTDNILIDAEGYVSFSSDFGELKAYESMLMMQQDRIFAAYHALQSGEIAATDIAQTFTSLVKTKSYIRYGAVDFDVRQIGASLNMDWIISSKLIAKLNVNYQNTNIDNYYEYSQSAMIQKQFQQLLYVDKVKENVVSPLAQEVIYMALTTPTLTEEDIAPLLTKYGVRYDDKSGCYYFGNTEVSEDFEREDGYKHKASPSIYGNIGLIYHPMTKLTLSAYAYYMGEREFTTIFGKQKVGAFCTTNMKVGFKPISQCEIYFAGHNLLNTRKREFIYTDKLAGTYTIGMNFSW